MLMGTDAEDRKEEKKVDIQEADISIEGFSEEEAKRVMEVTQDFVKSYSQKGEGMSDREWLVWKLKQELPDEEEEKLHEFASQVTDTVEEFDRNTADINEAGSKGIDKETWFLNKVKDAATGISVNEFGNYLNGISNAMENANAQMMRTVTTQAGNISQCVNLDGFIAEQHAVNTFNMQAQLENSPFRAEVCTPKNGETYGLNSFDVVIKDTATGKIANQYQFKFGKDAKSTIALLKDGNYNNQRFVVPSEQVAEVQKAFPGKSVEGYIGGTQACPTRSKAFTKADVKEMQVEVQDKAVLPRSDWNNYNTKDLVTNIGKNAALTGVQAALITTGFDMVARAASGQKIDSDETVELALRTGADSGIKAATAGALKVSVERGYLTLIPKGTPAGVITNLACISIENAKILMKVARGEMTVAQGLDHMAKTSTAMVYGLGWGAAGMVAGSAVLSWIPIVGPFVGGIVGGAIGYIAGSKVGETIYEGIKKVGQVAKRAAKSAWEGIKSAGRSVKRGLGRLFGR